ncbi:MAG: ABC transporter substrate-binding protein [Deltaproteobacteria bacterium]|nr:ABC transporter substrate-binding protein [Deltaproteobacteria bacterium]
MRKLKFISCAVAVVILLFQGIASGQATRVASLGLSAGLLPLWVAQDKRFFEREGLKTELITFQGGAPAIQALLAGEVKFGATGASSGVNARLNGAEIMAIGEYIRTLPFVLVVNKEVDTAQKLRRKKIAISRFGTLSYYAARLTVEKLGLDPDKDVQLIQIGNESLRFAALRQGSVDATAFTPPYDLAARKLGFRIMVSLHEAGVQYAFNHLVVTRSYAAKNKQDVSAFLRGFLRGIAFMKLNRKESVEVLKKWTRLEDQEALEEAYKFYSSIIPEKPYGSEESWRNLVESIAGTNPQAARMKSTDLIDYSYLREIDASGFIDSLYR